MLLQLTSFAQVPRPHRVVQSTRPQLGAIWRYVYAASAVSVTLELSVNITMVSIIYIFIHQILLAQKYTSSE